MAGPPSSRCVRVLSSTAALALVLAACESRTVAGPDEGIVFGDTGESGESGGGFADDGPEGGIYDSGGSETGGSTGCTPQVETLTITDATDPAEVACVEEVFGDLTVGPTTQLEDLQLLGELRRVGGTAYIAGNLGMTSLAGLEQLEEVSWLHLRRNDALEDLGGLGGLVEVERITVTNNDGLLSLHGLPDGLDPNSLEISNNAALETLTGLPLFVDGDPATTLHVEVEDNPLLTELGGISDCCSTQKLELTVARSSGLEDLSGLEAFSRLEVLELYDNPALVDLEGIPNLSEVGTLEISYNPCLELEPAIVDLAGAEAVSSLSTLRITWATTLVSLAGLDNLGELDKLQLRHDDSLPWSAVADFEAQTSPTFTDLCGGEGWPGPCPPKDCPKQ